MRALSRNFTQVEGCINCLNFVHHRATRSFRLSPSSEQADEHTASARKVTTKKYSDLPRSRVLPDGKHAAPLEDWQGGLPPQTAGKRLIKPSSGPVNDNTVHETQTRKRVHTYTKRKPLDVTNNCTIVEAKTAHVDLETSGPSQFKTPSIEASVDCAAPPTRRRKTKAKTEKSSAPKISQTAQPRNQLATEILNNLSKFPHCLLLTRVGQFYESYFDQAIEVSRLLNIKLAHRTWDKLRIPMCGFPLLHLDKYVKILVQQNQRFVALCEEFPRPPSFGAKDGFDRKVTRIITPGTLIDESFLNPYQNNYLLAISPSPLPPQNSNISKETVGLAWIDVSTGEFFTNCCSYQSLRDELTRIGPREVVLDENLKLEATHPIRQSLMDDGTFVSYTASSDVAIPIAPSINGDSPDDLATTHDALRTNPSPVFSPEEASAIKLLTTFLHANLLDYMPKLTFPNKEPAEARMHMDSHTIRALEIRECITEGGTRGSLLSVIKRTVTSGGTRLLARWLCSPSTSITEIVARQSLVSYFHARPHLREDLCKMLVNAEDVTRIIQKLLLGRGSSGDLLSIYETIRVWDSIKQRFELEKEMELQERPDVPQSEWASTDAWVSRMHNLRDLSDRICTALHGGSTEDPDATEVTAENGNADLEALRLSRFTWRYGQNKWTIKPEFSDNLSALHTTLKNLLDRREELEQELQRAYNAPSLTLRSSPGQGMHVHLQRAKRDQVKINASPLFINISESGSTKTYFYKEWSILGNDILDATMAIFAAEKQAFESLRREVTAHSVQLRRNARLLDELDVTLSFANLAIERNFVRPLLKDDASYEVTHGRHPTVELGLLTTGRVFTSNSVSLTPSRVHVLTGPNMAGKSTFLRQTALIALLAQIGSFVPADHAVIGIVDKLFCRVGAKDDLFRDRSTFMVEMLETSEILQRSTPRSLVIMDEVGRGTTVKDGLAIAFATVHHLVSKNQSRTLFATHFHELSDMLGCSKNHKGSGVFENVAFYCTGVDDADKDLFAYSYSVKAGVSHDSHGLKVAELAGMPDSAMRVAEDTLRWLKSRAEGEVLRATDLRDLGQSLAGSDSLN